MFAAPSDQEQAAPRRLRADAQRSIERILAAADAVVERDGADAAIDEIVRTAGVGSATLYRHFPTRMALMEAVFRSRMEALCGRAHVLVEERAPQDDPLRVWLGAAAEHLISAQGMLSALVLKGLRQTDPDANLMWGLTMLREATDELVDEARRAGRLRPEVTSQDVVDILYGVALVADRRRDTTGSPQALAERLLDLSLDGLRA